MHRITQRWHYALGAMVMMAVIVLTGCTDAMVGPENTALNSRLIKATDNTTLQRDNGTDTSDNYNTNTRIAQRYFEPFPLPDTLRPPGTPPLLPPPSSRIAQRYSEPFPDSLRLPTTPPPSLPSPITRITDRYRNPIPMPPPDSTANGSGGNGRTSNGS